jgi:hypothetical protein
MLEKSIHLKENISKRQETRFRLETIQGPMKVGFISLDVLNWIFSKFFFQMYV